jgi:hypothetical protein
MSEMHPSAHATLSISRALIGMVTPTIRAVYGRLHPKALDVLVIIDGLITDELRGLASEVETEIIADYPDDFTVNLALERLDAPAPVRTILPRGVDWPEIFCVYSRYEPAING